MWGTPARPLKDHLEQLALLSRLAKKRKAAAGQKEMLMPIAGKKEAREASAKRPSARQRKSA